MSVKLINLASLKYLCIESKINEYSGKIQYNTGEINTKMSNYIQVMKIL